MNTREKREINRMHLCLPSLSVNEGVARGAVSVFCAQADPAVTQLSDIKCAVSEAVTNCIVHAYRGTVGMIYITAILYADGEWYVEEPREIPVLDRIGGGDGFVGGMLYAYLKGWAPSEWVKFGWATGAMAVTMLEDYATPADEEQVWSVWKGNARVKR